MVDDTGVQLRVMATTLNLRAGPGASHAVLAEMPRGLVVEVQPGKAEGWLRIRTPAGREGWAAARYLGYPATDPDAPRADDPAWYRIAWEERAVREVAGPRSNPRIEEYQRATTYHAGNDAVPWCSSFVNWCMAKAGIEGTHSAAARSWLAWGREIARPVRGCIVVFTRAGDPGSGHVAFYAGRESNADLRVLGGNQEDQVKVSRYPAGRVLGYRMPVVA